MVALLSVPSERWDKLLSPGEQSFQRPPGLLSEVQQKYYEVVAWWVSRKGLHSRWFDPQVL